MDGIRWVDKMCRVDKLRDDQAFRRRNDRVRVDKVCMSYSPTDTTE